MFIYIITSILVSISLICLYFNLYRLNKQLKQELYTLKQDLIKTEAEVKETYKQKFDAWCVIKEKEIRKDSVARSRNIMRGQATEHLAPTMIKEYSLKDYRFMGNPIDYIIFNGGSDVTDGESDEIKSIVFMDIKTGKSKLNKIQRRIRDCIKEGRVEFLVYNPDKET